MPPDFPCSWRTEFRRKMPISQIDLGREQCSDSDVARNFPVFFPVAGNWRPVREGLRPQPAFKLLELQWYLSVLLVDFAADLRGISATECNFTSCGNEFKRYLCRGGHRNLSRAISWLTSWVRKRRCRPRNGGRKALSESRDFYLSEIRAAFGAQTSRQVAATPASK
jgi:hypothetical protein